MTGLPDIDRRLARSGLTGFPGLISNPALLLLPALLLMGACGSGERQPSAAEVQAYTDKIDRAEAVAKAKAIREARQREGARDKEARARVPARN